MKTVLKSLYTIGMITPIFASMFNASLTWNADRFHNDAAAFDDRLTEMHTTKDTVTGQPRFFQKAKDANLVELGKLFSSIK